MARAMWATRAIPLVLLLSSLAQPGKSTARLWVLIRTQTLALKQSHALNQPLSTAQHTECTQHSNGHDIIQFFFNGLTERLRSACLINPTTGHKWSSLQALQEHAIIIHNNTARHTTEFVARANAGVRKQPFNKKGFSHNNKGASLNAAQGGGTNVAGPSNAGRGSGFAWGTGLGRGGGRGGRNGGGRGGRGGGRAPFEAPAPIGHYNDGTPMWPAGSNQAKRAQIAANRRRLDAQEAALGGGSA